MAGSQKDRRKAVDSHGFKPYGMDVASKQGRGEETPSFFFTEFPDNYGAKEMWSVFMKYDHVCEVVIPNRRDKRGKRFGFARFLGVNDAQYFARRLDNIIIGTQKLFVNLPRFQRDVWRNKAEPFQPRVQKHQNFSGRNPGFRVLGTSYAQATKKGSQRKNKERLGPKQKELPRQHEFDHQTFNVDDNIIQKMNKAYVGKVTRSGTSYAVQEELNKHGFFAVKATPLGANLVLLEAEDEEAIPNLINDARIGLVIGLKK